MKLPRLFAEPPDLPLRARLRRVLLLSLATGLVINFVLTSLNGLLVPRIEHMSCARHGRS